MADADSGRDEDSDGGEDADGDKAEVDQAGHEPAAQRRGLRDKGRNVIGVQRIEEGGDGLRGKKDGRPLGSLRLFGWSDGDVVGFDLEDAELGGI